MWGFRVTVAGRTSVPDWAIVLDYEQALRREAVKRVVYDGMDLKSALHSARKDTELREAHFVTQALLGMVVHSSGRTPPPPRPFSGAGPYGGGGNGKGKRKGGKYQGGKGKGGPSSASAADSSMARSTPDGRPICFAWNNLNERCRGQCNRAHVCRKCFGSHPVYQCGKESAKPQ